MMLPAQGDAAAATRPSTRRPVRRFTLSDMMALIIASASTLVMFRTWWQHNFPGVFGRREVLALAMFGLTAATPAVLLSRLARPRPTIHQLCRQPGFSAVASGTSILSLGLLTMVAIGLAREIKPVVAPGMAPWRRSDPAWWSDVILHFMFLIGPAVIVAWILLALSGRRRPGQDWLDRAGRGLGVGWIALFALDAAGRLHHLIR